MLSGLLKSRLELLREDMDYYKIRLIQTLDKIEAIQTEIDTLERMEEKCLE